MAGLLVKQKLFEKGKWQSPSSPQQLNSKYFQIEKEGKMYFAPFEKNLAVWTGIFVKKVCGIKL